MRHEARDGTLVSSSKIGTWRVRRWLDANADDPREVVQMWPMTDGYPVLWAISRGPWLWPVGDYPPDQWVLHTQASGHEQWRLVAGPFPTLRQAYASYLLLKH